MKNQVQSCHLYDHHHHRHQTVIASTKTGQQQILGETGVQCMNTIQYNSLLTLPWWGFSVTMRLLIKIREVVNNSIKKERVR